MPIVDYSIKNNKSVRYVIGCTGQLIGQHCVGTNAARRVIRPKGYWRFCLNSWEQVEDSLHPNDFKGIFGKRPQVLSL